MTYIKSGLRFFYASIRRIQMSTTTGTDQITQAENQLRELLADHFEAALHQRNPVTSPLITVPPGVGKSTLATEFVNRYSNDHGLNSLTFTLSLDIDQEIAGREHWNKWLGHAKHNCGAYSAKEFLITNGFRPSVKCGCSYRGQFVADKPTSADLTPSNISS